MGKLLKEQTDWPEETWLNLLQHATQGEIDIFLALLEQSGLKIIQVEKYIDVLAAVEESIGAIEKLEKCTKLQAEEIAALEYRIKTLTTPT